jgi:putative nucleotidyltransferase with HDIG domain
MLRFAQSTLGTRGGRRTLLLLIACALLPTSVLAALAYAEMRSALRVESSRAVADAANRHAVQIVERATWLAHLLVAETTNPGGRLTVEEESGAPRFRSVFLANDDGSFENLTLGAHPPSRPLDQETRAHVDAGEVAIAVEPQPTPRVWFVGRATGGSKPALVWAEADPRSLWGFSEDESLTPALCVVEAHLQLVLQCSVGASPAAALATLGGATSGDWIAASRSLVPRHEFAADDWRVVSMQSATDALLPVRGFGRTFALVALLSLLVVFLASQVQIRRQTVPLARLHSATKDVAAGKFDVVVRADSGDEFEALANSFMSMSSTLGRQFGVLHALDAVDLLALEASNASSLVSSAARTLLAFTATDRLAMAVPAPDGGSASWQVWDFSGGGEGTTLLRHVDEPVVARLRPNELGHDGDDIADAINALGIVDAASWRWVLFPLWHNDENQGTVAVGFRPGRTVGRSERREMRRLTDRLAMAFANVHRVQRLDALSLSTFTAFARAIDANSRWTAGHSERVAQIALLIADALGIAGAQRDLLQRGGLLHDIGKIGVPADVLNKAGRLSDQEMAIIRTHPTLGVSILEPIGAFHDIIPIVRSHHERVDGMGYPEGLCGENIPYLARILSVADVYDALVSARPYRDGMSPDAALRLISADAGRSFDPHIAAVFVALHEAGAVSRLITADEQADALAAAVGHGRQLLEVHS